MKKALLSMVLTFLGTTLFAQVLFTENFSGGTMPPTGWLVFGNTSNWAISQSNYAGGTIPEGRLKNTPVFTGYMRLISPMIDLTGQSFVILKMKHAFIGDAFTLGVDTRANYGTWHNVWTVNATGDIAAETLIIPINNSDAGSNKFQFCLYINGNAADFTDWYFDDITIIAPPAFDAGLASIDVPAVVTGTQAVKGKIFNGGIETVSSADVNWQLENGDIHTNSLTGLNLTSGQLYSFVCDDSISVDPGTYNLKVWISNVNGSATGDDDLSNDSLTKKIYLFAFLPQRMVVGEEATGTWCGWCVRGICFMDYMAETYPESWIGIAVHDGDPMAITEYDNALQAMLPGFPGFPSAAVDRTDSYVDPSELEATYFEHMDVFTPASVSLENFSWDSDQRLVTFDVQTEFIMDMNKEYRLAAVITEDSVHGTASGYNQHNYYAGGSYGAMCGFESLPATIPASDMYYNHVARKIMDTPYGTTGSLPLQITAGVKYTHTYTATLPAEWNYDKLHFIGMLLDASTKQIINATNVISSWVSVSAKPEESNIQVYPNPTSSLVTVISRETGGIRGISLVNLYGKTVREYNNFVAGASMTKCNVSDIPSGVYFLRITGENKQQMIRLVISR
jgi:hypothetical protein